MNISNVNLMLLVLIGVLMFIVYSIKTEQFTNIPVLYTHTNLPWWNTQIGTKRRMSWDLRGDPYIIPPTNLIWGNPEAYPIRNKSICS